MRPRPSNLRADVCIGVSLCWLAAPLLAGCLQGNPGFDRPTSSDGPPGSTSSGDAPDPTSTGEDSSGTSTGGETTLALTGASGSSTTRVPDESSTGESTGVPAACPYLPTGVQVGLTRTVAGELEDLSVRPCGASEAFGRLHSALGYDGLGYTFAACDDDVCGVCDEQDGVRLDVSVPDPFTGMGAQLGAGACAQLRVGWDHPLADTPGMCTPSLVALVRLVDGAPQPVPALLLRRAQALPVTDVIDGFELAATAAGAGGLVCPCDGDCCREPPGTRQVAFTATIAGEVVEFPTLESEQSVQTVPLGMVEGDATADLALVRALVPEDCGPPEFDWVLGSPPV